MGVALWRSRNVPRWLAVLFFAGLEVAQQSISAGPVVILLETSTPGVFAAGDVRHGSVKRVAPAVGDGSIAIRLAHDYLA